MMQLKSLFVKKDNNTSHSLLNLVFGFLPVSFILGSLVVNLNFFIFCCLGIYYLRSKILTTKFDFILKLIFLFFFIIFFSTLLTFIKSLYFDEYSSSNLTRLIKSILFFRFFLFLVIVFFLSKYNILRFEYFFVIVTLASILLSLDIIYQHFFGADIIGLKTYEFRSSGFFGDENIAGGYLLRFGFFAIFFTILVFKKKFTKFLFPAFVISILGLALLFSGNRMPLILFFFGLLLIFLLNLKINKILLLGILLMSVLFKFAISSNDSYKNHLVVQYSSFIEEIENTFLTPFDINLFGGKGIQTWRRSERVVDAEESVAKQKNVFYKNVKVRSSYIRFALAAYNTWKPSKIFGNGIKSFYTDCHKLAENPEVRIEEDQIPGKENMLCSNHPHNYYFQILTTTGIIGTLIIISLAGLFIFFIFKNLKIIKKNDITNIILLSSILSFFLEMFPIRSTGSFYTTNNITYIILIASIILSHKDLSKVK